MSGQTTRACGTAPDRTQDGGLARVRLGGEWPAIRAALAICGARRPYLVPVVLLAILAFLLEGFGIGLMIPLVQSILGDQTAGSAPTLFAATIGQFTDRLPQDNRLALIAASVCLLVLLKSAVIYAHHILSVWLASQIGRDLRDRLFAKTFKIDVLTLHKLGVGRLHNTLDVQVWKVSEALTTLGAILASLAAASVFILFLMLISWQLTLAVVAGFALISLLMLAVRRAAQTVGRQLVAANADLGTRIVETITHNRLIRAFGTERHERQRFADANEHLRRAVVRTELLKGLVPPATEFLSVPLMFAAIALGLALGLGMPTLLAYLLLLYRLQPHLREIDRLRVLLASEAGPIEDVMTLLEMDDSAAPRSGARPITRIAGSIRFEQVSFDYGAPGSGGVRDISFEIPSGKTVALVGPSGAGKSTIVGLLFRFFDPTGGRILVDGVPLGELDLAAWRSRLAFAGQDVGLMSGSVRETIAMGDLGADDAAIHEAARTAHADAFIAALPLGYDQEIGANGLTLSGGQRQRLTLARALLRQPDLLILDEATNALDAESEQIVLERLRERRRDASILVIAHRLSTVRDADLIVVIEDGRVVETGTPASLLTRKSAFNRLWERQTAAPARLQVVGK